MLWRLEEAFGLIPAVLVGSLLYAAYHIGYAMPLAEISFLLLVGISFAVVFRLTRNIFILWPVLQPMGQLVTLLRDGLELPSLASRLHRRVGRYGGAGLAGESHLPQTPGAPRAAGGPAGLVALAEHGSWIHEGRGRDESRHG